MKVFALLLAALLGSALASCPTYAPCRCKADAVSVDTVDDNGCATCYCAAVSANPTTARATTAAPTTARATTAAATTARATTAAPTTARATTASCPTTAECRCKADAQVAWARDENGCAYCFCEAIPSTAAPASTARATTAAATTARATTAAATTARATCPTVASCRCKADAQIAYANDQNGCQYCFCEAIPSTAAPETRPAETTARASTARATTAAATTARATCPTVQTCRCKADAQIVWARDNNNCEYCFCEALPSTAAPETRPAETTARATTARATTAAAASTRATCPTVQTCRCKPDARIVWTNDNAGCPYCFCEAVPAAETTVAPATARATTRAQCSAVPACRCKPGAESVWDVDGAGCPYCYCRAVETDESGSGSGSGEEEPATTAAPTRVPVTTARPATARATTEAAVETRPVCPTTYMCKCKPGAEIAWETDANGCESCYCRALPSTAAPETRPAETTARATTARATTAVATETRAATTAASACPTVQTCRCKPGAQITWDVDDRNCAYCFCQAVETSAAPATTARATTAVATTARATTARATTTAVEETRPAPTCATPLCRCKPDAEIAWTTDDNGCGICFCRALPTTAAASTARATTAAATTARATTAAATTARATTAAATTARATTAAAASGSCGAVPVCSCGETLTRTYTRDSRGCWQCQCVDLGSQAVAADATAASSGSSSSSSSTVGPVVGVVVAVCVAAVAVFAAFRYARRKQAPTPTLSWDESL